MNAYRGPAPTELTVADLAAVVHSAGQVFDGLSTSRAHTENFLRTGNPEGIACRADRALLQDLRDIAQFVIERAGRTIDTAFVRAANATIMRSGALHPGQLRAQDQSIGVATPYGRYAPHALTERQLQALLENATGGVDVLDNALNLFVDLAAAQPFEDGNKRTALFVANSLLIAAEPARLLMIPVEDDLAEAFNDLLARAYLYNETAAVKTLLHTRGIAPCSPATTPKAQLARKIRWERQIHDRRRETCTDS